MPADVATEEGCSRLAAEAGRLMGGIDGLVRRLPSYTLPRDRSIPTFFFPLLSDRALAKYFFCQNGLCFCVHTEVIKPAILTYRDIIDWSSEMPVVLALQERSQSPSGV